ncbi:hypothetical protein A5647_04820 [Mycobacterium sp. 1100029.7]|nr:hypothetical protein A5647_04820 [Mycobacterium sp. 1100029.7]
MGFAIAVLLVFVPIGLFMLLRPKQMWWTLAAWTRRQPDATEPSDAAYACYRFGGLGLIAAAIYLAYVVWPLQHDRSAAPSAPSPQAAPSWTAGVAPGQTEDRGALAIVGYRSAAVTDPAPGGQAYLDISYLLPEGTRAAAIGLGSARHGGCEVLASVAGQDSDHVSVQLRLSWTLASGINPAEGDKCRLGGPWSSSVMTVRVAQIRSGASIFTDDSIVDRSGAVLAAAAPNNPVPGL